MKLFTASANFLSYMADVCNLHKLLSILFSFQISLDTDGKNAWKTCVTRDKVMLPSGLYFGASAATGGLSGFKSFSTVYMRLNN